MVVLSLQQFPPCRVIETIGQVFYPWMNEIYVRVQSFVSGIYSVLLLAALYLR